MKRKGQMVISGAIVSGVVAVGLFLAGALGNWINRVDSKAQSAIDKTASLSESVGIIRNDVAWIKDALQKQQSKQLAK